MDSPISPQDDYSPTAQSILAQPSSAASSDLSRKNSIQVTTKRVGTTPSPVASSPTKSPQRLNASIMRSAFESASPSSSNNNSAPMSPLDKEGSSWSLKSLSYFHRSNSGSDQEAALGSRASLAGSTTGLMVDQEKQQAKIDFYNQRHGSSDGGFIDNLKKNWFGFLMMITLMALFIAGMIVVLTSTDAEDICATDACIKKAQTFLTAFNTTVNPCDDFYEFTCGAHIKATGALNELELVAEANKNIKLALLDAPYSPDSSLSATESNADRALFDKIHKFYNVCANQAAVNASGYEPIKKLLATFKQDFFPLTKSPSSIARAIGASHSLGSRALFTTGLSTDRGLGEFAYPMLRQSGWTISNYSSTENVGNLTIAIQDALSNFEVVSDSAAAELAEKVVELERSLKDMSEKEKRGEDYGDLQRLSFEALVNQYFSNFGWPDYFDTLLTTETRKAVKNASVILSLYPVYFSKMQAHLGSVEPATMEAYIAWNIIKAYIPYIAYSDDLKSIWRALGRLNQPVAQCLQTTESFFVEYFSLLFIRKNFGSVQKDYAKEMMEFIRTAMAVKFKQLEWLDPKTRDAAIEKLNTMLVKMGYPQSVLDVVEQNRQVKNLVLSDTHLDNIIKGIKNNNDNTFEYLTKPLDFEDLWIAPPLSVNAFYNPISNEIMFPAGILQEPAFNPSYPAYINYGVIGSIMGHETTHGFDSLGSKFNSKGQLADWWTPSTKDQFNKKTQCLKDQYNGFNVTIGKNSTLPVNGDGTIVENIADNGGIERAFEAWQMYVESPKGRSANYKLKGLEKYSQEQMLFISFARLWCTPPNPMRDFFGLLSDSHAPAKWRVNGPMSNSEAFSKTFQCPTGSPMNPVKKCHVW